MNCRLFTRFHSRLKRSVPFVLKRSSVVHMKVLKTKKKKKWRSSHYHSLTLDSLNAVFNVWGFFKILGPVVCAKHAEDVKSAAFDAKGALDVMVFKEKLWSLKSSSWSRQVCFSLAERDYSSHEAWVKYSPHFSSIWTRSSSVLGTDGNSFPVSYW